VNNFTFRVRVEVAPRTGIAADESRLSLLKIAAGQEIVLEAPSDQQISSSNHLVLRAGGWSAEEEALAAGQRYSDALALALVRNRIGAEFAPRQEGSERIYPSEWSIIIHPSNVEMLELTNSASCKRLASADAFLESFRTLADLPIELTIRERIAIELFSTSFFEQASDTRLLILVMAIEAMLDPLPRSDEAISLVDSFIQLTYASRVSKSEGDSMVGTLRWLKKESISGAGRRLSYERLGGRKYMDMSASKFFTHCYDLRSRLVHGNEKMPNQVEAGSAAAHLELFVSDLITSQYLPITD